MKKKLFSFTLIVFYSFVVFANKTPKDSLLVSENNLVKELPSDLLKKLNNIKTKDFHYKPMESEFNDDYIKQNFGLDSITNQALDRAVEVINQLESTNNFLDFISPDDLITLPVGIKTTIGNITYILGIRY